MKTFRYVAALLMLTSLSASALSTPVRTQDEAIKLTQDAIHKLDLTPLSDECRSIEATETRHYFELVVREKHTPTCGGDPDTGPRLFNVRVRKRDRQLTSDAYDGVRYRLLNHHLPPGK